MLKASTHVPVHPLISPAIIMRALEINKAAAIQLSYRSGVGWMGTTKLPTHNYKYAIDPNE